MNYLAGICPGALCAPIFSPLPTFFSPISLWFTAFSSWALLFPPLSAYFFDSACYYSSRNFFVECRRQRWKAIWKANSVLRSCCQEKLIPFNTLCSPLFSRNKNSPTSIPGPWNIFHHLSSRQTPASSTLTGRRNKDTDMDVTNVNFLLTSPCWWIKNEVTFFKKKESTVLPNYIAVLHSFPQYMADFL